MLIGVTGTICSGHDTFTKMLEENGFKKVSLSDYLRKEMIRLGIEVNRKNMQDFGDKLRKEHGIGFLVKALRSDIQTGENIAIVSIRNPGEVSELRRFGNFVLVKIDAPQELRFERLIRRGRDKDEPANFQEFIEWEKRDLGINQPKHGQQHISVFEMADYEIVNSGSLEDLKMKTEKFLRELKC